METHESEFAAPDYTILERKTFGKKIITSVIVGGELVEFEKDITEAELNKN